LSELSTAKVLIEARVEFGTGQTRAQAKFGAQARLLSAAEWDAQQAAASAEEIESSPRRDALRSRQSRI